MGLFGWSYPPGAENDPRAPYNQRDERDEPACWSCDHPHDIHTIGGGPCLEDRCECKGYEAPDDDAMDEADEDFGDVDGLAGWGA